MRLKDEVSIVTGAGTGIGQAIAERLASEGAAVVLAAIADAEPAARATPCTAPRARHIAFAIATPRRISLVWSAAMHSLPISNARHLIRFQSLKDERLALEFPCDAEGRVELDRLRDKARDDYLFARAVVGGEFRRPAVVPSASSDWSARRHRCGGQPCIPVAWQR